MSLKHILLGLLREPATGYDLKAAFNETIAHFWSAELAQIYPTLNRLEGAGLLESRVQPSEKGPNRRVYSLTGDGRTELLRWLREGPVVGVERFAYLAQVFFMDAVGDLHETRSFMVALRRRLRDWLDRLRAVETAVVSAHGSAPERYSDAGFHQFATLRMGIRSVGSKVEWCDETLAAIDRRLALASCGGSDLAAAGLGAADLGAAVGSGADVVAGSARRTSP